MEISCRPFRPKHTIWQFGCVLKKLSEKAGSVIQQVILLSQNVVMPAILKSFANSSLVIQLSIGHLANSEVILMFHMSMVHNCHFMRVILQILQGHSANAKVILTFHRVIQQMSSLKPGTVSLDFVPLFC